MKKLNLFAFFTKTNQIFGTKKQSVFSKKGGMVLKAALYVARFFLGENREKTENFYVLSKIEQKLTAGLSKVLFSKPIFPLLTKNGF